MAGPTLPDDAPEAFNLAIGRDGGVACVECYEPIGVYPSGATAILTCGCTPRLQLLIDRGADPEDLRESLQERTEEER